MEEKLKQITDTNPNCIKVVLYGPESTGKSTLAQELAAYYNTVYVEEFSRSYAEAKAKNNLSLTKDDVLPIAVGQMHLENKQLHLANTLLICDTDLLETQVYSQFYYDGYCPNEVKKYAQENTYDLYFLTYIDTVWEADGIRDQPNNRLELFNQFEQALVATKKPYVLVKGDFKERLNTCKDHIEKLINHTH
ncbi:AAA family ATPase [Psychroserpens algicola]|uniref:ATP-binding protein n=1 Tax=Psychroserpens algicola TaxID=1719034 RepID=A0ABT0H4D2_9FLAO|nr:ATP-binding protein [Psychroserpens algicola]MCK8479231.1 ATP-binding protein [Psychroserpens algicola]